MLAGLLHQPRWLISIERVLYRDGARILVKVTRGSHMAAIIRACIPTSVNSIPVVVRQE